MEPIVIHPDFVYITSDNKMVCGECIVQVGLRPIGISDEDNPVVCDYCHATV